MSGYYRAGTEVKVKMQVIQVPRPSLFRPITICVPRGFYKISFLKRIWRRIWKYEKWVYVTKL